MTSDLQVANDAVLLWSIQAAGGRGRQLRPSAHHQVTQLWVTRAIGTLVLEVLEVLEVNCWKENCRRIHSSYFTQRHTSAVVFYAAKLPHGLTGE